MSIDQDQATSRDAFKRLEGAKADRLKQLLKRKPGHKGYRSALRAYLEADAELQRAIIEQLTARP
jgi:hypothetical protein